MKTKNAECPKCQSLRWFIHEEASGISAKTCMQCGYEDNSITTEWELYKGIPVDQRNTGRMRELTTLIGRPRRSVGGLTQYHKADYYKTHKKQMIKDYLEGGVKLCTSKHPICDSTCRLRMREWGVMANYDLRISTNQSRRPRQKILV